MTEHTPGPWDRSGFCEMDMCFHIGTIGPKGCTGINIDEKHSVENLVADVWTDTEDNEETLANACLISAAPDLLKICKIIEANFRYTPEGMDLLRAAIAKAEEHR